MCCTLGNPVKDANGRFIKGDLVGYAVTEKRIGWGAEYPEEKRNGEWEYWVFTPDRKINEKANLNSCFECHKPHASSGFTEWRPQPNRGLPPAHPSSKRFMLRAVAEEWPPAAMRNRRREQYK